MKKITLFSALLLFALSTFSQITTLTEIPTPVGYLVNIKAIWETQ